MNDLDSENSKKQIVSGFHDKINTKKEEDSGMTQETRITASNNIVNWTRGT